MTLKDIVIKSNDPVIEQEKIDKALDELVGKGEILASCPNCKQYLSYAEKQLLFCKSCDEKINNKDILYFHNLASGQNN